jgi:hypothetical protein
MTNCLKIGHRLLDGDQIISALVQYKLLETLVGQLLLDEALKEMPFSKQELLHTLTGGTDIPVPENFDLFISQWCQRQGFTPEYFKAVVVRELRIQKFKQLRFANQVESEFLRIKTDLDQVEYSLIQLTDLALAQEVYFQLRDDGAEFARLAQRYSLGSERQTGGWIGPISLSALPIEIATLFRNQQTGIVYGPVPVADIFWIVRLEQFTAARLTEATRTMLINRLYNQWLQTQVKVVTGTPGAIAVQPNAAMQPQTAVQSEEFQP